MLQLCIILVCPEKENTLEEYIIDILFKCNYFNLNYAVELSIDKEFAIPEVNYQREITLRYFLQLTYNALRVVSL